MEESHRLNSIDCRQYYQLGLVMEQDQHDSPPDQQQISHLAAKVFDSRGTDDDVVSECGSEDVETVSHLYHRLDNSNQNDVAKSIAEEIRNSLTQNHVRLYKEFDISLVYRKL